jgi:hypothetical protein
VKVLCLAQIVVATAPSISLALAQSTLQRNT